VERKKSGLKERRRRRSDEEEDEARLDAFDGSLSVSLSSSSSFLFALSSAPFLLLLYFCHVEPIKPKVSPRLARKGAEQKQQQQKRKRERMRRCCFFSLPFSLRSIEAEEEEKNISFFLSSLVFSLTKNRILAFLL
jgi:hypothetical protein